MPRRSLTLNACTTCRKKRTKCDGRQPCSRCTNRRETCHFEDREWQTKEHLRSELKRLQRQNDDAQAVLRALLTADQQAILQKLRSGEPVGSIAQGLVDPDRRRSIDTTAARSIDGWPSPTRQLSDGPPILDVAADPHSLPPNPQLGNPNAYGPDWYAPSDPASTASDSPTFYTPSPGSSLSRPVAFDDHSSSSPSSCASDAAANTTWTRVTYSIPFMNRLLDLFFAWEVVPFYLVYEPLFRRDYAEGRHGFCSPALVNAIMSLASRHLTADEAIQWGGSSSSLGECFFQESANHLAGEGLAPTLASIQALGLLAVRDICCGREAEAESMVLEALERITEMDLDDASPEAGEKDYCAARAATLSGVLSLARMVRIATDQLSPFSTYSLQSGQVYQHPHIAQRNDVAVPRLGEAIESLENIVHRLPASPSFGNFVFELTELVYSLLPGLQGHEGRSTIELSCLYQKCLAWYASASESLKDSGEPTPYALFVHIYFHLCLLVLFRPFIHLHLPLPSPLPQAQDPAGPSPRTICAEASHAILALTQSYARLFALRRAPFPVPHFVLAAGLAQLDLGLGDETEIKIENVPGVEKDQPPPLVQTAVLQLEEMASAGHPVAERACRLLCGVRASPAGGLLAAAG